MTYRLCYLFFIYFLTVYQNGCQSNPGECYVQSIN